MKTFLQHLQKYRSPMKDVSIDTSAEDNRAVDEYHRQQKIKSGMTIGELERRAAAGEIIPMNADDDPFRKAQKRMGDALHRQKLDAQRRRGRPPTPEEEAADRLRYSIS